jgi:hypothetical protein
MRILLLSFLLTSCSLSPYRNETYNQCGTNPKVDGLAIGSLAGISLGIASASTPIGLGAGIILGGSYALAHNSTCKSYER